MGGLLRLVLPLWKLWKRRGVFHNFPEAPLPPDPRGRGLQRKRKPLPPCCLVPLVFLKKEMKFLLTKRRRSLNSSSSAGKNGKASRFSGEAVSPCLEAAASLSSARFRLYHILFPAGQKVKLSLPQSLSKRFCLPKKAADSSHCRCFRQSGGNSHKSLTADSGLLYTGCV